MNDGIGMLSSTASDISEWVFTQIRRNCYIISAIRVLIDGW